MQAVERVVRKHKLREQPIERPISDRAVLVGGQALTFHGAPRFTEDIDFLVHAAPENARRIESVLEAFGLEGWALRRRIFSNRNWRFSSVGLRTGSTC